MVRTIEYLLAMCVNDRVPERRAVCSISDQGAASLRVTVLLDEDKFEKASMELRWLRDIRRLELPLLLSAAARTRVGAEWG